jgi:Nucleoside 2-deoxyribosyltransferase
VELGTGVAGRSRTSPHPVAVPRVYFARAIDGQDSAATAALVVKVREELEQAGLTLVDPVEGEPSGHREAAGPNSPMTDAYRALVDHDLSVLRTCDAVLMDMTLPGRNYIGCVCELTYAYLWNIPCVVYLGNLDGKRPWLHYHAAAVFESRSDAISFLTRQLDSVGENFQEAPRV